MSGRNNAASDTDSLPPLPDARRSGLLSDIRTLEMRKLRGGMGTSTLAGTQSLSDIRFADPLDPPAPPRPADPRPPAITPVFIEPKDPTA